MRATTG